LCAAQSCIRRNDQWRIEDARDSFTTEAKADTFIAPETPVITASDDILTGTTSPSELLSFAKTLIGVPYKYASIDPRQGFDCSGFITYVFNHFNIAVPRSSVDFTNVGKEIPVARSAPGDLILFTGTDSTIPVVGHMGIITENEDNKLHFIHSTSGRQRGVVITPFEDYYKSRFVKVIRIFPQ
jgi:cell wall-associated NlpC family hydrolase